MESWHKCTCKRCIKIITYHDSQTPLIHKLYELQCWYHAAYILPSLVCQEYQRSVMWCTYGHFVISQIETADFAHWVRDLWPVNHLLLVVKVNGHCIVKVIQHQRLVTKEADVSQIKSIGQNQIGLHRWNSTIMNLNIHDKTWKAKNNALLIKK